MRIIVFFRPFCDRWGSGLRIGRKVGRDMNPPALEVCNVTIRYAMDAVAVIQQASCTIGPGERVALLGLNGSGKTTLLMAIAGIVPFVGEIRVGGLALSEKTLPKIRESIGFLFNVPEDLFPHPKSWRTHGALLRSLQQCCSGKASKAGNRLARAKNH